MCGLFGIIPSAFGARYCPKSLRLLYVELAEWNDTRGGHAWGLWGKEQNVTKGRGDIFKNGKYQLTRIAKFWDIKEGNWLAGHTRFGTHGATEELSNAHPFDMGRFMIAHNGVVSVDGFTSKDHPVDSGRIGLAINKHGFKEGMLKVKGSCGLLVSKDGILWVYRHQQQLHYAKGPWGWAVSSDKRHLELSLKACKLGYTLLKEVPADVFISPWTPGTEEMAAPCGAGYGDYEWDEMDDCVVLNRGYYGGSRRTSWDRWPGTMTLGGTKGSYTMKDYTCETCGLVDHRKVFPYMIENHMWQNLCDNCAADAFRLPMDADERMVEGGHVENVV